MKKIFFSFFLFALLSHSLFSQQATNSYFLVNGGYTNYSGDVNSSCYPVLAANSEWGEGAKQLITVGFGSNLTNMFTKISSWSRQKTNGNYDVSNYLAIGENGNTYTPGSFLIGSNLGIGTSSPSNKLSVSGGQADIRIDGNDNNVVSTFIKNTNSGTYTSLELISAGNSAFGINNWANNSVIEANTGLTFDAYNSSGNSGICFQVQRDPKLFIQPNGNVLIGKTTQSNSTYKLDVSGNIRANKLVVNTTGADYVFNDGYRLRSLAQLESYINQNKHLPGIEPAKKMQEEGMSVGETQTKLLEKIEELTLYVIDQNKKLEELSKINKQLEQKNAEIEKKNITLNKRITAIEQKHK
jgi:hypothetical protein